MRLLFGLGLALLLIPAPLILDCRDVGGEFDHLERLAVTIEDWVVGRLNPDFPAALGDALEFVGNELAAPQPLPESPVFRRLAETASTNRP